VDSEGTHAARAGTNNQEHRGTHCLLLQGKCKGLKMQVAEGVCWRQASSPAGLVLPGHAGFPCSSGWAALGLMQAPVLPLAFLAARQGRERAKGGQSGEWGAWAGRCDFQQGSEKRAVAALSCE